MKNEFPEKYYLVKFVEDLCDEGDLIKVCVISGEDMKDFLKQKARLSFGNMCDERSRDVDEIASYKPITEEELSVLQKFGLDDLESGHFCIDDDDEDEEELDCKWCQDGFCSNADCEYYTGSCQGEGCEYY